jgi:hypothetical protein
MPVDMPGSSQPAALLTLAQSVARGRALRRCSPANSPRGCGRLAQIRLVRAIKQIFELRRELKNSLGNLGTRFLPNYTAGQVRFDALERIAQSVRKRLGRHHREVLKTEAKPDSYVFWVSSQNMNRPAVGLFQIGDVSSLTGGSEAKKVGRDNHQHSQNHPHCEPTDLGHCGRTSVQDATVALRRAGS